MPSTRVPLVQGFYQARSVISSAQRSLNLYAEQGPKGEDSPTTTYLTPGLLPLGLPPEVARVRGLYRATNGELFAAVGANLYFIDTDFTSTLVGATAAGLTPVKMGDNGTTMVVVDGSASGWTVDLVTHAFAAISDPAFYGSNFVEEMDTYLIFNKPDTGIFYCTDSNSVTFDPLFFAEKTGYADKVGGIAVQNRNLWIVGDQATTEIWFDAGAADFPFQIMPGPFIEHGTISRYTIAKQGGAVFWLGQDPNGTAFVVQGVDFKATKISTPAIEYELGNEPLLDSVGFCYEQEGHAFYWLKIPGANGGLGKDFVYDLTTGLWHERGWLNPTTCEQETHRAFCHAFAYDINIVGDRENGQLYNLDPHTLTDAGAFIERRRGYPHMMTDGSRVSYPSFIADVQGGTATTAIGNGVPEAVVTGATFVVTVLKTGFQTTNGTLLQDYYLPAGQWGTDAGQQFTQIDDTIDLEIENNQLVGAGTGSSSYLAAGVPTSPDYIIQYQVIPAAYDAVPTNGSEIWMIGRADGSYNGYKAIIKSDGSTYQAALEVMGAATTTVEAGLLTSGRFQVYLSLQGSAIDMAVQRTQDDFWLSSDATWGADFAKVVSLTDTTYTAAGRILLGGVW